MIASLQAVVREPVAAPRVPVELLGWLGEGACTGRVFRAFDHLITAGPGWVMAVPVGRADGCMADVEDACPVPYEDALAVIDAEGGRAVTVPRLPQAMRRMLMRTATWWAAGVLVDEQDVLRMVMADYWVFDAIGIAPGAGGWAPVCRGVHASGLRVAVVNY